MGKGLVIRLLAWLVLWLAAPALAAPGVWVIKKGEAEVTLYGTVHALPPHVQWLTPTVTQRLAASERLVIEAVLPKDPADAAPVIGAVGFRSVPEPLTRRIGPPADAKLAPAAAEAGVPLAVLDRMDTWLAALTLSQSGIRKAGLDPASGVDKALEARAAAQGKPVVGLETLAQQLGYFDSLPETEQRALLVSTLDENDTATQQYQGLIKSWLAGDVDTIASQFAEEADASPAIRKALLTDRNARWADWLEATMRKPGKTFVAVGAAHLGGPEGLVALMKARGAEVEKLE